MLLRPTQARDNIENILTKRNVSIITNFTYKIVTNLPRTYEKIPYRRTISVQASAVIKYQEHFRYTNKHTSLSRLESSTVGAKVSFILYRIEIV